MTPAPHTPVQFLLKGGAGVFSGECIQAFRDCNINPNWIGTFGALEARMRAARETVEAHQTAIREGRKHPGEDSPSFEDRWLAACTNGHIGPDAAHRAAGRRGNHCETLVDGYTENGALAMATLGGDGVTGTVEGDLSRREAALHRARRDATPGSDAYSESDRRQDQDALISTAVDSHRRRFPDGLGSVGRIP